MRTGPRRSPTQLSNGAPRSEHLYGALLVAVSAAAFGAMPIFARFAYADGADVNGVLVTRFVLSALVLALIAQARRVRWPRGGPLGAVLAMGAIGYSCQSFLYFSALNHADAGLVALLLYSFPFIVAALAVLFLGERLDAQRVVALLVASAGLALTIGGGRGSPLGIALGLGAALVYAVYIVVGSRVLRDVDPIASACLICAAAAVSYGAIAVGGLFAGAGPKWPAGAAGWLAAVAVALVSTVLAIGAFFAGLRRLGATLTSVLSTLEPVVSVALASLLLGEPVGPLQALGGTVVISTAIWLALHPPPR